MVPRCESLWIAQNLRVGMMVVGGDGTRQSRKEVGGH